MNAQMQQEQEAEAPPARTLTTRIPLYDLQLPVNWKLDLRNIALEQQKRQRSSRIEAQAERGSIVAAILSTFLMRLAGRTSFVLLGFYLGEHFTSAALVAIVLEAFYLTELGLAPIVGSLSDRIGRKPFLLAAPLAGAIAALSFVGAMLLFPHPNATPIDARLLALLLLVLIGRLLEGTATALNAPASLGYLTGVTSGSPKLRARVMTVFEVATVGGLALAIPFAGGVGSLLDTWGFFVVIALHVLNAGLIACHIKEHIQRKREVTHPHPLTASLSMLRQKRIFTFLPAWLSINALVGAWITLSTIMLTYPEPTASLRHPEQLLYGGFSKAAATMLIGAFGLLFLAGMGLWMLALPHLRRTTIMYIGLAGLGMSIAALSLINGLPFSSSHEITHGQPLLLALVPLAALGVLLLSGFTPAALNHMAANSEVLPRKRGAVMGLYSVVMGVGQLIGAAFGGVCVDMGGFYGLMGFSVVVGVISLASVYYIRSKGHDLSR